ncbi:MAG: TonB-dependent receptor plug domain-containing protein [Pseudomonadales bacterium]
MNTQPLLLAATLLLASPARAAETPSPAAPGSIEEIVVVGEADTRRFELAETLDVTPDAAVLLRKAVGANVNSNGPLSGMAQYRGMSRMRISSRIDGQVISPGGPNWMDPPLSYAPAAHLESLEVHRGIASVSAGMETIGGVVDASTWQGSYADAGTLVQGRLRAGGHSVNDASLLAGALVVASVSQRLKLSGLTEQADDAEFPGGTILPTRYERDRYDVGYGLRFGTHELSVDYGHNDTGDSGTPALPMDIGYIDSDLFGFGYGYRGSDWQLDGRIWVNGIDHGMTNYHLRTPPMDPSMYRRNVTSADNAGFSLSLSRGTWQLGIDGHDEQHDSDVDNPNNPAFFVTNFNAAERTLLGVFAQKTTELGNRWSLELGGRYNRIVSDAGVVDATPAVMGLPPAVALRDAFNDADRHVVDHDVDLVAKLRYVASDALAWYLGVARKTRAPSYQERYLWLPLEATAGLADGRTYTGRIDLDPETAREIEMGFDYAGGGFRIAPRIFYRDVLDYIEGSVSTNTAAVMFVRMMNQMNGTSLPDPLEFNNVDTELYGADVDWSWRLAERVSLEGVVNYVRGKTADDNLYRVAPLNAFVALKYDAARWGVSVESYLAAKQDKVAAFNGEQETGGWAIFNVNGYWHVGERLRLSAGVENLADEDYTDHLGGINRVMGNPDITVGERLPGYGRNVFARADLAF